MSQRIHLARLPRFQLPGIPGSKVISLRKSTKNYQFPYFFLQVFEISVYEQHILIPYVSMYDLQLFFPAFRRRNSWIPRRRRSSIFLFGLGGYSGTSSPAEVFPWCWFRVWGCTPPVGDLCPNLQRSLVIFIFPVSNFPLASGKKIEFFVRKSPSPMRNKHFRLRCF